MTIFITNLSKITDTKYNIGTTWFEPFNENTGYKINGVVATKEQLEAIGKFVDVSGDVNPYSDLFYNPITNTVFNEKSSISSAPQEQSLQEQINDLGKQLAQEKLSSIQKDSIINGLGQQVADLKLQVIKIQGGTV